MSPPLGKFNVNIEIQTEAMSPPIVFAKLFCKNHCFLKLESLYAKRGPITCFEALLYQI